MEGEFPAATRQAKLPVGSQVYGREQEESGPKEEPRRLATSMSPGYFPHRFAH